MAVLAVAAAFLPVAAQGQSLADAAAKSRKERKGAAKVYTEDDLRQLRAGGDLLPAGETPAAEASPAPGAPKAGAKAEASEEQQRAEKKADLEKRLKQQEGVIERVQKLDEESQQELANPTSVGMLGGRREALLKIVEDDKAYIAKAQQEIEAIREEARRAGIALSH